MEMKEDSPIVDTLQSSKPDPTHFVPPTLPHPMTEAISHFHLPCRYGKNLHIISPNTKSLSNEPINVNGMHSTPSKISENAKFRRNTLVMVRIRRFCTNVRMTSPLPITASNRMVAYNGIWTRPDENHTTHGGVALFIEFRWPRIVSFVVLVNDVVDVIDDRLIRLDVGTVVKVVSL